MQKWLIAILVFFIIVLCGVVVINFNVETEYIPETEIEDKELRKTIVSLYFQDKISKEISKESRLIDSKNLLREPYHELLKMLISGPENENLEKVIPEGTKINQISLNNDILTIDFSNEFVEKSTDDIKRYNSIKTIVKTLTELTEINGIKLIIDGKEIDGFKEINLDFKDIITTKKFEE